MPVGGLKDRLDGLFQDDESLVKTIKLLVCSKEKDTFLDSFTKGYNGDTLLHFAIRKNYMQSIESILKIENLKDSMINICNNNKQTPLSLALEKALENKYNDQKDPYKIWDLLLKSGAFDEEAVNLYQVIINSKIK